MSEGDSLSSVLERRAGRARGSVRFLGLREDEEPIAFSRFAEEAGRVGAGLRARGLKPGALLGLMVRSDMNFARVFLGAVAAGVVPVPLYPPASLKRIDHYLDNLRGVLAVLGLDAVVVAPEVRPVLELVKREGLRGVRVLDLDEVTRATEDPIFHRAAPDELAFIQCTSGSTSVPKPVMIRHENVLANLDALGQQGGDGEGDAMCLWLPMYHDMGLLGLLRPLRHDHSLVLMEPQTFLRRPVRWLHGFSRYGATMAGGPSFGYELLVRKVSDEQRAGLDLSSWRLAYNGAEPIRVAVVEQFIATYAPFGLRREIMMPCYGMSETTLTATLPAPEGAVLGRSFARDELEAGRARQVDASDDALTLSGVGRPLPGHDVKIINADTGDELAAGEVGTVVITGPSVSPGYLHLRERTEQTFGRWVNGDSRTWLRTSDLGFFHEQELFVVGRADDVIIVRGRNIHPSDIEAAVEELPGIRRGCSAAVRLAPPAADGAFAIVAETQGPPSDELARAVEGAVRTEFQVQPEQVLFVPPGTIPKTSSGKISRGAIRKALAAGELKTRGEAQWLSGLKLKARITFNRVRNAMSSE